MSNARSKKENKRSTRNLGAPPGTLVANAQAPKPRITFFAYNKDDYIEQEIKDLDQLPLGDDRWSVLWLNVDGLGDAELIGRMGRLFSLHRLALEDVLNVNQRPKVERYPEHLFMVTRMPTLAESLQTEQLSIFLGPKFVITLQERVGDCLDTVRDRIRRKTGRVRLAGADYLAYAIMDAVTDHCFPLLEEFGERVERLEGTVLDHPEPEVVSEIHGIKRDLLTFRRFVWPLREAFNWLVREEDSLIQEETRIYLRDCYDHVTQIIDMLETHRELCSGLMDGYMSSMSNRMNEVMKVLTIIATIFIPITFIAGIYGMNFENMPELKWRWGYWAALGVMLAVVGGMLVYFRRKRWL